MKREVFVVLCSVIMLADARPSVPWSSGATMRVDLYHAGTKGKETLTLDRVCEEGPWPGSVTNLIDTLDLGEYLMRVYDLRTNALIFSHSYSTMFNEWQTTDDAVNGVWRTFQETVRLPFPVSAVVLTVARRDAFVAPGKKMAFREFFSTVIDPQAPGTVNRERRKFPYATFDVVVNGPAEKKVDIVILGDGYAASDAEKFRRDARHFADVLLSTEPFKRHKTEFNIRAISVVSEESGVDKPDRNIWKQTALGTGYNTFGSARYVLIEENKLLHDIASLVPYEYITVLINDDRYGGGGIYNQYTTAYTKPDAPGMEWQMDYVYVHEFGHCFAGLADEYYTSQVSYNDFYPKGTEPWEPNVTAATDRSALKWGSFVHQETPVPTPWEKSDYDSLEAIRGTLDRLAPDYYQKREPLLRKESELLKLSTYAGVVGTFEGSGYAAKGLYRPAVDCRMFTLSLHDFDPVCAAAIERIISFETH